MATNLLSHPAMMVPTWFSPSLPLTSSFKWVLLRIRSPSIASSLPSCPRVLELLFLLDVGVLLVLFVGSPFSYPLMMMLSAVSSLAILGGSNVEPLVPRTHEEKIIKNLLLYKYYYYISVVYFISTNV
jgi:hypothetical protein